MVVQIGKAVVMTQKPLTDCQDGSWSTYAFGYFSGSDDMNRI